MVIWFFDIVPYTLNTWSWTFVFVLCIILWCDTLCYFTPDAHELTVVTIMLLYEVKETKSLASEWSVVGGFLRPTSQNTVSVKM